MLVNGSPNGFFSSSHGLRVEDPLTPLFVFVMVAFKDVVSYYSENICFFVPSKLKYMSLLKTHNLILLPFAYATQGVLDFNLGRIIPKFNIFNINKL